MEGKSKVDGAVRKRAVGDTAFSALMELQLIMYTTRQVRKSVNLSKGVPRSFPLYQAGSAVAPAPRASGAALPLTATSTHQSHGLAPCWLHCPTCSGLSLLLSWQCCSQAQLPAYLTDTGSGSLFSGRCSGALNELAQPSQSNVLRIGDFTVWSMCYK